MGRRMACWLCGCVAECLDGKGLLAGWVFGWLPGRRTGGWMPHIILCFSLTAAGTGVKLFTHDEYQTNLSVS